MTKPVRVDLITVYDKTPVRYTPTYYRRFEQRRICVYHWSHDSGWRTENISAHESVLHTAYRANHEGAEALVIDGAAPGAVDALRRLFDIPVIDAMRAALAAGADAAERVGLISPEIPITDSRLSKYRLAPISCPTMHALGKAGPEATTPERPFKLLSAAKKLVKDEGCGAVILGTSADAIHAQRVAGWLLGNYLPAPVIAPVTAGVFAAAALWARAAQSKISYPFPPDESPAAELFADIRQKYDARQAHAVEIRWAALEAGGGI